MAWIPQENQAGGISWWNNATFEMTDKDPGAFETFAGKFAAKRPIGNETTDAFDSFVRGLAAKGVTEKDLSAALDKTIQLNNWQPATPEGMATTQDDYLYNLATYGDQDRIRIVGQALDALGKDSGWKDVYNPNLASQQSGAIKTANERARQQYEANSAFSNDIGKILTGFAAVAGIGALGGAFGGAAVADVGVTAAGDAGFLTAGGVSTPATGGMFVGNSGLLGGTGNAIADAALNGVVRGGVTSALTGGDPVSGALTGGITGGFAAVLPTIGMPIVDSAVKGAVSGGVGAAVNGGDILTGAAAGGAAGGVGAAVRDVIPTSVGGNALTNAAAGAAAGAVGSAVAGGDVTTGLIKGGVAGGTAGALTDAGVNPTIAGAAGTAASGLISAPTPDAGTPAAQQQQTTNEITSGLGFSVVLPQFQQAPRKDMQWGTRLQGAQ